MAIGILLIACPSCSCHAFARETHCPACGSVLRASDGSLQRTAGAVMLGLTLAASSAACGSDVTGGSGGQGGTSSSMSGSTVISAYGVGPGGGFSTTSVNTSGTGGAGGTASTTGMGGFQVASAYGAGPGGGFSTGTGSGGTGG